jgi:hypothetical protein
MPQDIPDANGHETASESSPVAEVPPAPPLPPPKYAEKASTIALKVRSAPAGWAFEGHVEQPSWDHLSPPAGVYFFYGTLQDPSILSEILGLPQLPILRPARLIGYSLKMWGQYPALVDGPGGSIVEGATFEVADEASAARLAEYETRAYRPRPCLIRLAVGSEESTVEGYTFMYDGKTSDLSDGVFDLKLWLRRMRRL